MKKIIILLALFSFSNVEFSVAQNKKYWVMFTDKNGTPFSVATPSAYLSPKSIQRRINQGIAINNSDLPVNPAYVAQIAATPSVTVLYRSKWLNGVVVLTNTTSIATINSYTFVSTTNKVNKYKITLPIISNQNPDASQLNSNKTLNTNTAGYNYGEAIHQTQLLGVDCLHNKGFRGQGMTIAILDDGFNGANTNPIFDSLFLEKRLLGTRDFVTGDTLVFEDDTHGAYCLSTMAGNKPGTIIGTAPKAKYWLLRTEDVATETISEEYNWCRGIEFADSVGADVTTTSLGYTTFDIGGPNLNDHSYATLNGRTAPMSIAANMAARKGIFVLNAAGNDGGNPWHYIGVPSDADSICTVGAVDSLKNKAGFSSFGPTFDGRIKPDLCSQGWNAFVCGPGPNPFYGNGTSFATPILAGAVTCLWQSKPFLRNMQLMAGLKQYAHNALNPNNNIGWGVPNMCYTYNSTIGIGIKENEKDNSVISIYPNPANNQLTVNLNSVSAKQITLKVIDVLGKEVKCESVKVSETSYSLNLSSLNNGAYFILVTDQNQSFTKKFMKQ